MAAKKKELFCRKPTITVRGCLTCPFFASGSGLAYDTCGANVDGHDFREYEIRPALHPEWCPLVFYDCIKVKMAGLGG